MVEIENEEMKQYLDRVKGMKSNQTFESRRTALRRFSKWLQETDRTVMEIDGLDLEDYLVALSNQNYAPNTIGVYFDGVRNFYGYLERKGEIEESPASNVRQSNLRSVTSGSKKHNNSDIVYVTAEEKEQLVEHAPEPRMRNRLIIRLLWQTGVRGKELSDIQLEDLDRDSRSIHIYSTKTDSSRTVFYQPSLDFLLDKWLDGGYRDAHVPGDKSAYLFPGKEREKLGPRWIRGAVTTAAERAGIQEPLYEDAGGATRYRIGSHSLRHGHCVHALKSGINIRTIQKQAGHSSLEVTQKYLRIVDDDVKEEYKQFGDTESESFS
ncbi:MAG: tyrosine-type recombinase/integrase [Halopenitus sp.]